MFNFIEEVLKKYKFRRIKSRDETFDKFII